MINIQTNRILAQTEISNSEGCTIKLWHKPSYEEKANRLAVIDGANVYEFYPSKGLSVGQVHLSWVLFHLMKL